MKAMAKHRTQASSSNGKSPRTSLRASNTLGSDYWVSFDEAFMEICAEMVVIRLDGWQRSSGVKREIAYFTEHKKPIRYLDPPISSIANE
jgi:hypothetical protein